MGNSEQIVETRITLLQLNVLHAITRQGLKNPLIRDPGPAICGFGPNIF
jgi:hypothetical protein